MAEGFIADLDKLKQVGDKYVGYAVADLQPIIEDATGVASESFEEFSGDLNESNGAKFFEAKDRLVSGLLAIRASVENCGDGLLEIYDRYTAAEAAYVAQFGELLPEGETT